MTTELNRFEVASVDSSGMIWKKPFIDEDGKVTCAIYKFHGIFPMINENYEEMGKLPVYRLDGRSIRYMQRVRIIENGT